MSDCCRLPQDADDRCHRCGGKGRRVPRETMESLLKPEALERLSGARYFFDRTPGCEVVYFSNEALSYFTKNALKVRVGIKETAPPIPICHCFGHTAESAREEIARTGGTTIPDAIAAEIRAGNCSCEVRNPSGGCCLGEVNRVVGEIENEIQAGMKVI